MNYYNMAEYPMSTIVSCLLRALETDRSRVCQGILRECEDIFIVHLGGPGLDKLTYGELAGWKTIYAANADDWYKVY